MPAILLRIERLSLLKIIARLIVGGRFPDTGPGSKRVSKALSRAEQRGQQPDAAVTILNTSGMNDRVKQQTLHVDENMSFLAFDQFAHTEPVRINAGPPFSAFFTLWLSMMQAVGLASRSAFSRHSTYSA